MDGRDCYVGMKVRPRQGEIPWLRGRVGTIVKIINNYPNKYKDAQLLCSWEGLTTGHSGSSSGMNLGKSGWYVNASNVEPVFLEEDDDESVCDSDFNLDSLLFDK